jgi:hypothetical protein
MLVVGAVNGNKCAHDTIMSQGIDAVIVGREKQHGRGWPDPETDDSVSRLFAASTTCWPRGRVKVAVPIMHG